VEEAMMICMMAQKGRRGILRAKDLKGEWCEAVIGIYLLTEDRIKLRAVVKMATKFLVM
jgi:hypothetical protein